VNTIQLASRPSGIQAAVRSQTGVWLTRRQGEVLGLLEGGLTNKQIAGELQLRPTTVAYHLRELFSVAGVTTRTGLLSWWIRVRIGFG
jgi:DNA-binding CsgD family transcriptional regulator